MGKDNENPQQCRLDMLLSHQLQGVKLIPQKCHLECTPNFYRGPTEQRRNAKILSPPTVLEPYKSRSNVDTKTLQGKGSTSRRMLCQPNVNPSRTNYRGPHFVRSNAIMGAPPPFLFGATTGAQKCQPVAAPKGRSTLPAQKCQAVCALPNQLQGSL